MVGQHLYGLVGGSNDVGTETQGNANFTQSVSQAHKSKATQVRDSPLVILASQRSVHQLADGSRVADVVDDHNQRQLPPALPVDLVRHIGEVQLQLLPNAEKVGIFNTVSQTGQKLKKLKKIDKKNLKVGCGHLLRLMMHVEGDDAGATLDAAFLIALGRVDPVPSEEVAGQTLGQVGLPSPAGARQDQSSVLQ